MVFWNKKKRKSSSRNGPSTSKPTGKRKYQPLEVKVMAMEAKEAGERPRIILITAYGSDEIAREAGSAGFNGFLAKPIGQSTLFDTIMRVYGEESARLYGRRSADMVESSAAEQVRGARVLLVEDNEINQLVAIEMLGMAGVLVQIANNGREAVDAVVEQPFDAVLMDLQMPEMDGYEATRAIRCQARFRELPIIAMTAHAMKFDRERILNAGMNDHVAKPIDTKKLFNTLAKWVRARQRRGRRGRSAVNAAGHRPP